MNKVFKRIWNAARCCWVVVSEAAGVGQTRGCGKKTVVASAVCLHIDADIKRLVVSALAWAVCSCFALPTHASWITDHGGVKNELTWTVGTDGTTTWKPLENQEFEILKGETLIVGSKGSNYSEASVSAIPNTTAGNRITNRGTYKINWTGNKIQANAENEGNFIDNYGTVAIVMNQTPNFGFENTLPNGMLNHNMAAWEIYRWNMNGVDAAWLKEKPAFYNRQGAEFIIDVNVDSSKLTSDKDATKFGSSITGIAINGSGDRAGMAGKNAGHIKVDIENAGSKTYGLYLRQKGNAFTNEKTGVFDIGTTYKKPADNFLNPTLLPYAVGIKLGSSAELRNEGTFNIDVAGNRAYGISIGDSASSTSHLVNAAGGTFALKTKANSKNAKDYAILFDVETDAIIDNYGTMTGTATALGTQAQGIGFFNAGGRFNNYAGAKLDLTAMAQATNESAVKVFAKGIYLNRMEQFVNNGSATLSAIVDGAGTDKVTNGWAIDARDANTQVVNNKELNLNYTGALGGGVILIKGATFSNNATATITVNRPVNEVVRTGLTGIRALNTSTITNAGNLSISMTGAAPTTAPNESRNQGGDMTGLYVAGTEDSIISLSNKKNSKLDINVNVSNAAEGQTNGIRPYGMILSSHAKNEGTMDVTVTGNYGKVTSDYGVFAAMGFNIDGENASKETALAHPRIENSGLMKANVSFNAQGMTPTLDPAKAKGWATGLNMHGTATLVNSGTLQSKATSTVNAKAASIQGSELINNKDAAFEAEATGNGSFAAALQVGRPNADMVEIPSYVLNDVNGTLTLTAKSPIGSSYGIYESAGKVENKGMLTVTAEGRDANGISLSNEDLERRDGSNPEFNNSGTLTVHANALETVPTMYHEAQALLLKTGSFVNSGTLDAFATASGLAEGMKISDASFTNQKGGILNLTLTGLKSTSQLIGLSSLNAGTVATNGGSLNLKLTGKGAEAYGLKSSIAEALFTNNGTLSIESTGTFGKVSAIDWAGKIANTGTIKTELGVKLGSLTNTGRVSTADMMVTGSIQNDRNAVMQIGTLKTKDGKTKIRNDGTLSISNAENRVTVQNTGVLAIGSFKNVSVQNKGTLVTDEVKIGGLDRLVNGGTILAEKITVDGLLQNRNGTFALGTAAVAKYLEKHLDLAQQLKDLGETLPTSVEALLSAQADAEAASLTTLELADGERSVESDDKMSETTESTDFASLFATVQAANTPQGRLATREGRLAFAGFSTYADNRAQLERQLQSGLSGLWADVIASQSEMDGYKANRSGIAVGLQGTNDAGLTFGVAARYSDGKLKGDALTSENWTSAGGSTYAAWANDDAFVSGFIGYDNLKTKGSDKFTNDVVSVGVKSGLKLAVGPVHVTPFIGGEVVHQKVKGLDAATTYRFPMGVGLSGQYETYGAWQVHPSLEVAYVPQAGDKVIDVTDKVDSRFTGNYAVESRLGIAVEKKNLMLGINYHGSAGDAGLRSHSLQANLRYRF